eukprot:gene3095-6077_t
MVQTPPLPQVVITNYGLAHRQQESLLQLQRNFNNTEYNYWKNEHEKVEKLPKYLFFQSAKSLHGRKGGGSWSADLIRRNSEQLRRQFVDDLGFVELDEFIITVGRIDNYGDRNDGWHFFGTMKQMEAVILINMICNDWLINK